MKLKSNISFIELTEDYLDYTLRFTFRIDRLDKDLLVDGVTGMVIAHKGSTSYPILELFTRDNTSYRGGTTQEKVDNIDGLSQVLKTKLEEIIANPKSFI